MSLENTKNYKTFASILSDGLFHIAAQEGEEGAILRKYETSSGEKGEKWEKTYDTLSGIINGIYFRKGDYGNQLHVVIDDINLSMNADSSFAIDFMKKLPNINIEETVIFGGYSFITKDTGKRKKGISIVQSVEDEDEKIQNFFWNEVTKKPSSGFPVPKGKTKDYDTDDWKVFFISVTKFLVKYTTDNHLIESTEAKVIKESEEEADKKF